MLAGEAPRRADAAARTAIGSRGNRISLALAGSHLLPASASGNLPIRASDDYESVMTAPQTTHDFAAPPTAH